MRIHTKTVLQWEADGTFRLLEDCALEYSGKVTFAGSSGGGTTSTSIQKTDPPEYLMPYLNELLGGAQGAYRGAANQSNDPNSLAGLQYLTDNANTARQTNTDLQGQYQGFMKNVLDVNNNPALRGYTDAAIRPLEQQFSQSILPGIRSGATEAGQAGSTRQGIAEGLGAQSLQQQSGDVTSRIFSQAYGQGLDAYTKGLSLAPQVNQLGEYSGRQLLGVADTRAALPYANVNRYSDILSRLQGSSTSGTNTGPGAPDNTTGQVLGSIMSLVAIFAMCFVAEVLYGKTSEKTLTIRSFVSKHEKDRTFLGRFFRLYIKYGKTWAAVVERNSVAAFFARIIWDKLYKLATKEKENV